MRPHALLSALFLTAAALPMMTAGTITATLPEFNGTFQNANFPQPTVVVGSFSYTIPIGQRIVAAVFSSTFGNSTVTNTAGVDVSAGGIMVGSCAALAPCDTAATVTPFSFTFLPSSFSTLASGSLVVTATQTSGNIIRLGTETLSITTATPEPGSVALLGLGLISLGVIRRRFTRRTCA